MSGRSSAKYVYSMACYPNSPLAGEWVFVLGKVEERKQNGNENHFRVRDAKGVWEGYTYSLAQEIALEKNVRGYGQIKSQPDGSVKVALQWIKEVDENEMNYCEKQTQKEWEKVVLIYPELPLLAPFENKKMVVKQEKTMTPKTNEKEEFVSANELQIEREYV